MSDPRMIPADEAQRLREELRAIRETPFLRGRDDGRPQEIWIGSLYSRLAREHAEDLAYTVERQAAQIERVREELKALRDYYIDREARSRERLESATDEREQSQFARFEHMHRRTHEALTRILEGHNDE